MENKINIAELLKDCPKGMELDCAIWDNCTFEGIEDVGYINILVKTPNGLVKLSKEGYLYHNHSGSKCVIFPKGKTTWEGFVPPCKFKDGDVLYIDCTDKDDYKQHDYIFILDKIYNGEVHSYCHYYITKDDFQHRHLVGTCLTDDKYPIRFATEEEKAKLFQAIKDNGYKWNPETKTLEKLVEPRFKVGDRIKAICNNNQYDIKELTDTHYTLVEVKYKFKYTEPISEDKKWELVPSKFDISTLIPFESRVLVRNKYDDFWEPAIFGVFYAKEHAFKFCIVGSRRFEECIPYEGNEHLLGTTDDCDNYYKNWE